MKSVAMRIHYLTLSSQSILMQPSSSQSAGTSFPDATSTSLSSNFISFRGYEPCFLLDFVLYLVAISATVFACENRGCSTSFVRRDSITEAAMRFGTKGNVSCRRGICSGVMIKRLRHMGQSTDSCQVPQWRCNREKNHFRMQSPQKVWPQREAFRTYGAARTS